MNITNKKVCCAAFTCDVQKKGFGKFCARPIHHFRLLSRLFSFYFMHLSWQFFSLFFPFFCRPKPFCGIALHFYGVRFVKTLSMKNEKREEKHPICSRCIRNDGTSARARIHSLNIRKHWPDALWECKPMLDFNKISMNSIDELFFKVVKVDLSFVLLPTAFTAYFCIPFRIYCKKKLYLKQN